MLFNSHVVDHNCWKLSAYANDMRVHEMKRQRSQLAVVLCCCCHHSIEMWIVHSMFNGVLCLWFAIYWINYDAKCVCVCIRLTWFYIVMLCPREIVPIARFSSFTLFHFCCVKRCIGQFTVIHKCYCLFWAVSSLRHKQCMNSRWIPGVYRL